MSATASIFGRIDLRAMVKGIDRLKQALREKMSGRQHISLAERRGNVDGIAAFGSDAKAAEMEWGTLNGVAGAWFRPDNAEHEAAILYAHGGAFVAGSPASHQMVTLNLARSTGIPVFSVAYRLAPEHPHPAAVDDLVLAFRGLMASGLPAHRIIVAGDSAGATLLLLGLCALRSYGVRMPGAAVMISPLYDLTCTSSTYDSNASVDPFINQAGLMADITHYLPNGSAAIQAVQDTLADLSGLPPMLIQVGSEEVLLGDARMLAANLERDGGRTVLEVWPGMPHVWHLFPAYVAEASAATEAIASFIRSELKSGPAEE